MDVYNYNKIIKTEAYEGVSTENYKLIRRPDSTKVFINFLIVPFENSSGPSKHKILRAHSLVVSNLSSETKGSRFESRC